MVKFGRENQFIHQLCLAHACHLSICDIFYGKKQLVEEETEITNTEEEELNKILEDWDDCSIPLDMAFDSEEVQHEDSPLINQGNYDEIISKVRKICKAFRKSPLKNDYLQDIVKANMKKEMKLILDTKTRWNSTIAMIKRFCELKKCIPAALRRCEISEVITENEWRYLEDLVQMLRPFEIVIKGLSTEDATILKGEQSMKFVMSELKSQSSILALKLEESLHKRYTSKRLETAIGLIKYLEDPDILHPNDTADFFHLPTPKNVKKLAVATFKRLYPLKVETQEEERFDDSIEVFHDSSAHDITDPMLKRYEDEVTSKNKRVKLSQPSDVDLMKEMKFYEATRKRTENLELLYQSLLTIKATSVESERAFSAAGYFLTKLRSQLAPKTLDALSFLRCFYNNK